MHDLSSFVQASAAAAGTLGGGIAFLWGRIEMINKRTKAELEKCAKREIRDRERRGILITAFEYLVGALRRYDPHASEITQSLQLLSEIKARDRYEEETDRL